MSVDWDSEVIVVKRKEYDDLTRQLAEANGKNDEICHANAEWRTKCYELQQQLSAERAKVKELETAIRICYKSDHCRCHTHDYMVDMSKELQQIADLTRERDEYNIGWNNALEYNSLYTKQLITRDELIDRAKWAVEHYRAYFNSQTEEYKIWTQWLADAKKR